MNNNGGFYEWLWWHVEGLFGVPPEKRRPWTFVMRDIYHQAAALVVPLLGFSFSAIGALLAVKFPEYVWLIIGGGAAFFFPGLLVAHLFWGKPWVPGELPEPKVYEPSPRIMHWMRLEEIKHGRQKDHKFTAR